MRGGENSALIQFQAGLNLGKKVKIGLINEWNIKKRFAKAESHDKGHGIVRMDYTFLGGAHRGHLDNAMSLTIFADRGSQSTSASSADEPPSHGRAGPPHRSTAVLSGLQSALTGNGRRPSPIDPQTASRALSRFRQAAPARSETKSYVSHPHADPGNNLPTASFFPACGIAFQKFACSGGASC